MSRTIQSLQTPPINWTPSWTGFSTPPTVNPGDAYYVLTGKLCAPRLRPFAPGVSNAATMTVTLPFVSANTVQDQIFQCIVMNSGTIQPVIGRIDIPPNSNVANIRLTVGTSASFAIGSNKCVYLSGFEYLIA